LSAVFVLALLGVLVVLLAVEKLRADMVAMLGLAALILSGILEPGSALSGFSNPATITVACMFILSAGLHSSGLVRVFGDRLLKDGPTTAPMLMLVIGILIAPVSAFINNTAAVAVFMPIALRVCHGRGISPSRILMPLSFFAMLGGTCTMIGTTNKNKVSNNPPHKSIQPVGIFELNKHGQLLLAAGAVYLMVFGGRLLPERIPAESLTEGYHLNRYLSEVVILDDSPIAGLTLPEAKLGERFDLEVLGLYRDKRMWGFPGPDLILKESDVLIVKAPAAALVQLRDAMGVVIKHGRHPDDADLRSVDSALVEVVVAPNSALEGRTVKTIDFRHRYGATALAIRRHGEDIREKVGRVRLQFGDELLIMVRRLSLSRLREQTDFVVLQELDVPVLRPWKALMSLGIVGAVVGVAAMRLYPIAETAVVGSVLMVLSGCLPVRKVYTSVDWKTIILLAGLIPMGSALEITGAADSAVNGLLEMTGSLGPQVVLGVFMLFTVILTGFMSNNATAVLLAPLAITTAQKLGVDARPFLVALTFAASAAFYTPIGYQTNLLVYGPGGYRFIDFVRLGAPLNLLHCALASFLIPLIFPF
jgi:di/tricarboxylate transporter